MNVDKLLAEALRRSGSQWEIPGLFTEFVEWLGITPTLAQRVVLLVCYDGLDPCDLVGEEREMARKLFGDVETVPNSARQTIVHVCGRRGGKSYLFEALPLVYSMFQVPLFEVAPGQIPVALVVSPNDELRQEVINYAIGAIRSHPQLRTTLVLPRGREDAPVVSEFMVRRPGSGELVAMRGAVATEGGYGGRGKSLVALALDEVAFFRTGANKVNDKDIFEGAMPGLLPGAWCILGSTPWAQAGLLWELFERNHGHPDDALVSHAPTQLLRPVLAEEVEADRLKDPERVSRERDATFMGFGTTQFFASSLVDSLFSKDAPYPLTALAGCKSAAAADLGFRSDSSALVGTIRLPADPRIRVAKIIERRPLPGMPLKPSETAEEFHREALKLGCTYIMADWHYIESLRENSLTGKVQAAPSNPGEVYVAARTLMREGNLVLPHPDTQTGEVRMTLLRLKAQLLEVQGRPVPGGGMSIVMPRWRTGGHGDLASALVLATYQMGGQLVKKPKAKDGSPEWEREQLDKRKQKARERNATKWYR